MLPDKKRNNENQELNQEVQNMTSPYSLIGGKSIQYCTFLDVDGVVYSTDNVRLGIKFPMPIYDELFTYLDRKSLINKGYSISTIARGKYRNLYVLHDENEHTVTVGLGFNHPSGKVAWNVGFIEFNPNKVYDLGHEILQFLERKKASTELQRYDLAVDYPYDRNHLRLVKDNRRYEFVCSNSVTEYLGRRNKPGRVKVYDKTAEMLEQQEIDIGKKVTRIELTCKGDWEFHEVFNHLPQVYDYDVFDNLRLNGITRVFCLSLAALCAHGDSAESYLTMLEQRSKAKIRKCLRENLEVEYAFDGVRHVIADARAYEFGNTIRTIMNK